MHRTFGVEQSPGLTDRLAESHDGVRLLRSAPLNGPEGGNSFGTTESDVQEPIYEKQQEQVGRLGLLPAGTVVPQPGLLLQDAHLRSLLDVLSELWEVILIDSPPALLYDDVFRIAALSDLVLLLAAAEKTHRSSFGEVRNRLETVCPRSVASILNFHEQASSPGYGYGGDYYAYSYSSGREEPSTSQRLAENVSDGVRRILKG